MIFSISFFLLLLLQLGACGEAHPFPPQTRSYIEEQRDRKGRKKYQCDRSVKEAVRRTSWFSGGYGSWEVLGSGNFIPRRFFFFFNFDFYFYFYFGSEGFFFFFFFFVFVFCFLFLFFVYSSGWWSFFFFFSLNSGRSCCCCCCCCCCCLKKKKKKKKKLPCPLVRP